METALNPSQEIFWGAYENTVQEWIERQAKAKTIERLWEKDASLWKKNPADQKEIKSRLGWLAAPKKMHESLRELNAFAAQIKDTHFSHIVLLGMGGSSLAPELFQATFGNKPGYPELLVLDSTDPGRIKDFESKIDLEKTLFIVSSKSGGTIELVSLFKYFFDKVKHLKGEKAGDHFIAITDPGSPLADLAKANKFKKVFLGFEDVGGRFSALTSFGLVPAALIGVDIKKIVESAERMSEACSTGVASSENAAMALGVGMAVLAEEGRDKLTIITSCGFESFGDWAEQLVAESTGKEETGVIPVVREPLAEPSVYGNDRFFVALLNETVDNAEIENRLEALKKAGHPVLVLRLKEAEDLGAEFFRWEMATAISCALLKINAFDQPDVQAAKDKAREMLKVIESGKSYEGVSSKATLETFWEDLEPGDYIAVLAFLHDREDLRKKLAEFQSEIRNKTKRAVTIGIGPRYLHSTGQLHKGGPNTGGFILLSASHAEDLVVPGEAYTFAQLELAQGLGDLEALELNGRNVFYAHLENASEKALDELLAQISNTMK